MKTISLLILVLLLAACATLTPEQRVVADQIDAWTTKFSTVYRLPKPHVQYGDYASVSGATSWTGLITVNTARLAASPRYLSAIVAHELAHYALGHGKWHPSDQAAQRLREMDADAKAVEIIVRVMGYAEADAFRAMHQVRYQSALRGRTVPPDSGHSNPCVEANALAERFPAYPAPRIHDCP